MKDILKPEETPYDHFKDLDEHPNSCPMYLNQLNEIDKRWPNENQGCLDFFHRKLTLSALREFVNKIGQ